MPKTLSELMELKAHLEKLITQWDEENTKDAGEGGEQKQEGVYIEMGAHHGAIRRAISVQEGEFVKNAPNEAELDKIFLLYQDRSNQTFKTTITTGAPLHTTYEDDLAAALASSRIAYEEESRIRQEDERRLEEGLQLSNHTHQTEAENRYSDTNVWQDDNDGVDMVINESFISRIIDIRHNMNNLSNLIVNNCRDQKRVALLKESLLLVTTEDYMHFPEQAELLAEINSLLEF